MLDRRTTLVLLGGAAGGLAGASALLPSGGGAHAEARPDLYDCEGCQAVGERAPGMLSCAGAQGELVITAGEKKQKAGKAKVSLKTVGAGILALLAAYELIDGQLIFALLQLCGGALVLFGGGALSLPAFPAAKARGVATVDEKALLDRIGDLCRAADVCCADLALLERESEALWQGLR